MFNNRAIMTSQENIEQHQAELSNVLKEGKADVLEKQKQIKQLRHDVDDLTSTKADLEAQVDDAIIENLLLTLIGVLK